MKRFILECMLFSTIMLIMLGAWIYHMHVKLINSDHYLLEHQYKLDLVKKSDGEPRLILLGGSNVAFGVSAKMLSDSLGINVINYGLHAGIGLRLPMLDLEQHLREGDIVVCMPEYENFFGNGFYGEPSTLTTFLTIYPNEILNLSLKQIPIFLSGLKSCYLSTKKLDSSDTKHKGFCYSKNSFNELGDEISHLNDTGDSIQSLKNIHVTKIPDPLNEASILAFSHIIERWRSHNVQIIAKRPVLYDEYYYKNEDCFKQCEEVLSNHNFIFIGTIDYSIFQIDAMFDSTYHLNAKATSTNTERIIFLLREFMNNGN